MASPSNDRMRLYPEFHAILIRPDVVRKLNILLSPSTALSTRGVSHLAGEVGFCIDEISYIESKTYPFLYFIDQWIKRSEKHNEKVTLNNLHDILLTMKRLDAAQLVENEMKFLHDLEPKEVQKREEILKSSLQKKNTSPWISNGEPAAKDSKNFKELKQLFGIKSKKQSDNSAPLRVVYCIDDDKHRELVRRFVKKLRNIGIDATADMFDDLEAQDDHGFYIAASLMKAEKVIVVCSPLFFAAWNYSMENNNEEASDEVKKVSFIMHIIISDLYRSNGRNSKYIPVIFKETYEYVPSLLASYTKYSMPKDIDNLKYRLFDKERYKLAPLPKKQVKLKQIVIGSSNGDISSR